MTTQKFFTMAEVRKSDNRQLSGLAARQLRGFKGTKAIRLEGDKNWLKGLRVEGLKGNMISRYWQNFVCPDFIRPFNFSTIQPLNRKRYAFAFTMAEILISLTIIGVIAAITLPALQANINEKAWTAQRKALYSRMSQAIALMPSLNGYGVVMGENGIDEAQTASKAAQAFISDGLSKVLKISNICDSENLQKCGFPDKFIKMGTNSKMDAPKKLTELSVYFNIPDDTKVSYSQINTNSVAFETVNGESILTFYNPNCTYTYGVNGVDGAQNLMQPTMCANFIYDLNGRKGPNKVGKDIGFITAFYPADSEIVAPMPIKELTLYKNNFPQQDFTLGFANAQCRNKYGDDARMANIEELKSVFTNNVLGQAGGGYKLFLQPDKYLSSTSDKSGNYYYLYAYKGSISVGSFDWGITLKRIFCTKK